MFRLVLFLVVRSEARLFCEETKMPLEVGTWRHDLIHMDSAVVENKPVSISEGQVYVYENYFPGYVIQYVHVDNVAIKTCGASAAITNGGVGSASVLVVLHAPANQEIRSVVDVWGSRGPQRQPPPAPRSRYLFPHIRALSHNRPY